MKFAKRHQPNAIIYYNGYARKHLDLLSDSSITKIMDVSIAHRLYLKDILEKEIDILSDTHSIHHYAASWVTPSMKLKGKISSLISKCVPVSVYTLIRKTYRLILQKK